MVRRLIMVVGYLSFVTCIAACGNAAQDDSFRPGALRLTQVQGLSRSVSQQPAQASVSNEFDLGTIKGSASFYFLLQNSGDSAITDLQLSTSDPAFTVTPSTIAVLDPAAEMGFVPVVRVAINHGVALEGVGYTALLPMGTTTAHLTVNGTTTDGAGQPLALSLDAALTVNALVAAFDIYDGTNQVDLSGAKMTSVFPRVGLALVSTLSVADMTNATIRNTGNVPLAVRVIDTEPQQPAPDATFVVGPGEQQAIPALPVLLPSTVRHRDVVLEVDPHNTIADGTLYQIGSNGLVYLMLTEFALP